MSTVAVYLLFCCLLFGFRLSTGVRDYKYAIGPVCECLNPAEDLGGIVKTCYRRCMMEPEPRGRVTVELHQSVEESKGPSVVECTRVIQEQIFTQFWTFSTEASPLSHSHAPVTEEECKAAIQTNCPDYNCNHREADSLEPEYHYGSSTTVRKETISLLTVPSSIMVRGKKLLISPMSTPDLYDAGALIGSDHGKVYLWRDGMTSSGCPFKASASYGCDEYQGSDGSRYYMCSNGRFSITPVEDDVAPSDCKGLKLSSEGFLYTLGDAPAKEDKNGRIYITQTQGMTGDADYLRHKIQQSLTHLDSEICTNQCEILALESRVSNSKEPIVRVGMTYYKLYGNGTATVCKTINGCRLTKPRVLCGNPPRIGITCATNSGLWDPLQPYMVPGGVCMKPDQAEKLSFLLGSSSYVVDDDLTIAADRNFSHGVFPTSFNDLHQSGVQLKIDDLRGLKSDWDQSKSEKKGLSASTSRTREIRSPSLSIGESVMNVMRAIPSFFSTLEHAIGVGIIIIMAICSLWITIKLFGGLKYGRAKATRGRAVVEGSAEEQARWI
ncbi:TPA_asm: G [Pelargonium alphacytorhabdovirus 1]|nr:TPA_asm: G [Pelargonium alphacytorhabdovirus 1]